MTDPIADMFTRIRNAIRANHDKVFIPYSNIKLSIAKILKDEGFIKFYELVSEDVKKKSIKIGLKYDDAGKSIIDELKRISKPGKRIYVAKSEIPKVLNGFGTCIVTTPKGVLTGKQARLANVGGELIGEVY